MNSWTRGILIICLFSLSLTGFGQTFSAGLALGFNMSQIDGDKLAGYNKLGVATGARVDAKLDERWKLGMELLFSQMGSSVGSREIPTIFDRILGNVFRIV